jgi:hypothetical protein
MWEATGNREIHSIGSTATQVCASVGMWAVTGNREIHGICNWARQVKASVGMWAATGIVKYMVLEAGLDKPRQV